MNQMNEISVLCLIVPQGENLSFCLVSNLTTRWQHSTSVLLTKNVQVSEVHTDI